ncbi:MAG: septum formation protein Maf, partial [Oscillospiraceae bacterium]|nr:septum formation protein Maf [Oscillospiraceae bacterium]
YVTALARAKAAEVAARAGEDAVVIGADTIVWHGGRILGKPRSREEAMAMLRELSGETHTVYTGVCVIRNGRCLCEADESRVHFRPLDEGEIARYVDSGEPMDKAGAYAAQGKGAIFVRAIEGDFFNVMGLPLHLLDAMLKEQGVVIL